MPQASPGAKSECADGFAIEEERWCAYGDSEFRGLGTSPSVALPTFGLLGAVCHAPS